MSGRVGAIRAPIRSISVYGATVIFGGLPLQRRNGMKELDQKVFEACPEAEVACVDFDGLLKYGIKAFNVRNTWASERWRGAQWILEVPRSGYRPLSMLRQFGRAWSVPNIKEGN